MSTHGSEHRLPPAAREALDELLGRTDPAIVGIVLTGSAARGLETALSDVDVVVIRDEPPSAREVTRDPAIDEIPMTLVELETVPAVGTQEAWIRAQFPWAKILADSTGGRVSAAVRRQATLTVAEQSHLLIELSRFDGFINFAYRALKSHRDGRGWEARLDCAESIALLLDIVFAFEGRIRPYNKYLAWELREHPLSSEDWALVPCMHCLEGLLEGSEAAMRGAFLAVERGARRYDDALGMSGLSEIIANWGSKLALLRGQSR